MDAMEQFSQMGLRAQQGGGAGSTAEAEAGPSRQSPQGSYRQGRGGRPSSPTEGNSAEVSQMAGS